MTSREPAKATFAAGCFWGVESMFRAIPGVLDAVVGYTGGKTVNPTYEQVCTGRTGHAEAVEVTYDPERVSYDTLVQVFFENHDPTTPNRQGPDVGEQYRSAIFTHSPEQDRQAHEAVDRLTQAKRFRRSIVTQIVPAVPFYRAEEYHQRYFEKRGIAPTCHVMPK
ncbi:MAG TPA: peptide-methionine (S)-S-oxide reductase MsrA [Candidatus Eisenbacteria bacterium]|jgi:peptide-methionine (S)-S-oxide reductase|nr:peptide-methionine (S)-S-oxide reductase MsrA [Candidatus Eisenbacteria bacterium]